jgi:predicted dehydrogenase
VPYLPERCHGTFRWWYEYSGGKLTDWGAHHIDIAQWALDALATGPAAIEGTAVHDTRKNCFNTAQTYRAVMRFTNGTKMIVEDGGKKKNGILLEGDKERIFVNRGRLTGNMVDKITADPKWNARIREAAGSLYDGPYGLPEVELRDYPKFGGNAESSWTRVKRSHMGNFFKCIETGARPISDVVSVGNPTITCHLCNIALRLGCKLTWNPTKEMFVDDDDANAMLCREQREGYQIERCL